jgi:alpha-amylase/alpha-mannosidase (GH57 family)
MERYICIHAHFYQPPRENPWLEAVEAQPSAYPFHDWNERITAECYAPNGASRIVDDKGRILEIVNNYSKISFNFGPTLLSWMKEKQPEVYESILEADRRSVEQFSGHGSAMAQGYNHMILPLANRADKETQIIWGIRDFESRFGRMPEGMWLPETAVDLESLDIMAEQGLKFAILAPSQAGAVRRFNAKNWKDVSGAKIDPTQAYEARLSSGRKLALFFYDGPISRAVAFEKLLDSGEQFAQRLASGFSDARKWPQLMHIATDGESYGHHHAHGDMALAYTLRYIEEKNIARLTNYGEYLEKHPPKLEVQIIERTAWSCSHGVERWNSDCGCCAGGHDWNQQWRGPLRAALDWLRNSVHALYEQEAQHLFREPWQARNDYIKVVLDRATENVNAFFARHRLEERDFSHDERVRALQLLELQRHAMLMFTSCGWFFDELSGIETVKVMEYAGRVVQLSHVLFPNEADALEAGFLDRLSQAKSNLPEHGDGAQIYAKWVKPAMATIRDVAAHYAISSMFNVAGRDVPIYCYTAEREQFLPIERGDNRALLGRVRVTSTITEACGAEDFAVLHLKGDQLFAGVTNASENGELQALAVEIEQAFKSKDSPSAFASVENHFQGADYTLKSLFFDERRRILDLLLETTLRKSEDDYRAIYKEHEPTLRMLSAAGVEAPRVLLRTGEFVVNAELRRELGKSDLDVEHVVSVAAQAMGDGLSLDVAGLSFTLQKTLERLMDELCHRMEDIERIRSVSRILELPAKLGLAVNLWRVQNIYFKIAHEYVFGSKKLSPEWPDAFIRLGEQLSIRTYRTDRLGQPQEAA